MHNREVLVRRPLGLHTVMCKFFEVSCDYLKSYEQFLHESMIMNAKNSHIDVFSQKEICYLFMYYSYRGFHPII